MSEDSDKPKIIVDDDWKNQAQAEKEQLDEKIASSEQAQQQQQPRQLPPANFVTLVSSLASQVLMSLGGYEDPETKKPIVDLALAKHAIDTLAMLEEKTSGNLSDEEKNLMERVLYEVRMHYVQITEHLSAAPAAAPAAEEKQPDA